MTAVDWQRAHDRLEAARRSLEEGEALSEAAARRVLEARAQRLAQPLAEPADSGAVLDLLTFSRAGERYAVAAAAVDEVVPLGEPTPVPGVAPAVVGVVNQRGRIVPVVDLAVLLPGTRSEASERHVAVVIAAGEGWFALKADAVSAIAQVPTAEVLPAGEIAERADSVVRGSTPDMVTILDVDALARDPRIETDDGAD